MTVSTVPTADAAVAPQSLTRSAVTGIKWMSASTVIVTCLQIAQLAILARLLQPSEFGLMTMAMVVIGFAQAVADMGVSNAIIHHQDATEDQLSSLYWLSLLAGGVLFLVTVAVSPLIAMFYDEPRLPSLLLPVALGFVITPVGQQFQTLLQKELLFDRLAKVEVVATALGSGVAVLSALAGHGVFALVWGHLATATVTALLLAVLGWGAWRPRLRFARNDLKGYLSFGLYQMGERSLNYFSRNLDKVLIGKLVGVEALGVYSVAYQLMVRPMRTLNPIVTRVAFPILSKIQTDDGLLRRRYLQMIQVIAFVSMPMYLGMFALADPIIALLLGARWHAAVSVFQILVCLGLAYSLGNPLGSLLLAKGRADLGFCWTVVAVVVYAVAVVVGSPWGIQGIAWGILIVVAGVLFPLEFALRWYVIGMKPLEFIRSFLPFLVLGTAMAVVVKGTDELINFGSQHLRLAILVFSGMAVYLLAVLTVNRRFLIYVLHASRSGR